MANVRIKREEGILENSTMTSKKKNDYSQDFTVIITIKSVFLLLLLLLLLLICLILVPNIKNSTHSYKQMLWILGRLSII